jgi:hypothetical protein
MSVTEAWAEEAMAAKTGPADKAMADHTTAEAP